MENKVGVDDSQGQNCVLQEEDKYGVKFKTWKITNGKLVV